MSDKRCRLFFFFPRLSAKCLECLDDGSPHPDLRSPYKSVNSRHYFHQSPRLATSPLILLRDSPRFRNGQCPSPKKKGIPKRFTCHRQRVTGDLCDKKTDWAGGKSGHWHEPENCPMPPANHSVFTRGRFLNRKMF